MLLTLICPHLLCWLHCSVNLLLLIYAACVSNTDYADASRDLAAFLCGAYVSYAALLCGGACVRYAALFCGACVRYADLLHGFCIRYVVLLCGACIFLAV